MLDLEPFKEAAPRANKYALGFLYEFVDGDAMIKCIEAVPPLVAEVERLRTPTYHLQGLIEDAKDERDQALRERDEARAALVALCDLKRLKDRLPSVVEPAQAFEEYRYRRPLAWAEAFRIAYGSPAPSHAKEGT